MNPTSPQFHPHFNPNFQSRSARETKISDLCVLTAKNNFPEMQIWFDILERTLANSLMFVTYAKEDFQFLQILEDISETFTSKFFFKLSLNRPQKDSLKLHLGNRLQCCARSAAE